MDSPRPISSSLVFGLLACALACTPQPDAKTDAPKSPSSKNIAPALSIGDPPQRLKKGSPLPWSGHSADADLARLAGRWRVKTKTHAIETWTIAGAKVRIQSEGRPDQNATLSVTMPGALAVMTSRADGARFSDFIPFAFTPDGILLGRGKGGVRLGGSIVVPDVFGAVVYDGKTCRRYRKALMEDPMRLESVQRIKCVLTEKTFTYQMPTKRPGATFDEFTLMVKGDVVGDARFFDSRISPQP